MASVLVDGLAVEIKKSSMDAASDVEALAKSFKKLYSALPDTHTTKAGKEIKSIADKIRELGKAINELDSEKLKNLATVFEGFRGFKNFDAMSKSIKEAKKSAKGVGKGAKATKEASDAAAAASKKYKHLAKNASVSAESIKKLEKASVVLTAIGAALKVVSAGFKIFKKVISGVLSIVRKFASAIKNAASKAVSFGKEIVKPFAEKMFAPIKKFAAAYNKLSSSLARVAFYRMIRTAIKEIASGFKEGVENMYYWSSVTNGIFHNSLDSMATDLLYIRNSMASAVAPAINALVPLVTSLANAFASAANAVARFFALITGASSFVSAKRSATEYADALGGAAGSAEKLNKMLLGIDELNVFSDGSSGGGGGDTPNYSDMFEEVATGDMPDWLQSVKDAISGGSFREAGEILATKLNGIINSFDAKAWGKNLGAKIQNGIDFYLGAMKKFNWRNIGKKFSDFITGSLDIISPEDLGAVFSQKISLAFQTIGGFVSGLRSWESSTGNSIGTYLAKVIKGWFEGVNWIDAAATIREGFKLAIDNLFDFIDELKSGGSFFQKVKDFFTVLNFPEIWETFETMLFETCDVDSWTEISEKISTWFKETAIPFVIEKVPDWSDKLSSLWSSVCDELQKALEGGAFQSLVAVLASELKDLVIDAIASIPWGEILGAFFGGIEKAIWGEKAGAWFSSHEGWSRFMFGSNTPFTEGENSGKDAVNGLVSGVSSKTSALETAGTDMGNAFADSVDDALDINSPSKVLETSGENAMDGFILGIKNKLKELKATVSGITETFSELSSGIGASVTADVSLNKNGWTSLSSYVGNASARVPVTLYKSGWTSLKSFIGATTISVPVKITLTGTTLKQQIKNSIGTITLATNQNGTQKTVGSVYALAKGGIISAPTMLGNGYLAGEAGAEAVIPLENNTGWLDGVADRIIAAINSGSTNETVSISMDGDVFYRQMVKKQRQNAARTGVASSFA